MMGRGKYETVIGLEVHVQLLTSSKLFCSDSTKFNAPPNTNVSPVSLAHPGTLPKMNRKAIAYAIKLGLALHCDIERKNYFARKNYFYPDLPKGYQISQHTTPICKNGFVKITTEEGEKDIRLNRIHLEEDAGKSIHDIDKNFTCIDLNRAGVPLLELVTEPDLHSADEAFVFLSEIRKLVRYLEICDGNMEEGSMRCDANISIRPWHQKELGTKVEVKNLNSIRNVKKAIEYEIERLSVQADLNETIIQETRSFDALTGTTFSLRNKEEADDYRYFSDPDLTPFFITEEMLTSVKSSIPALPAELQKKYTNNFLLSDYDANVICDDKSTSDFFESVILHTKNYKAAANWIIGPVKSFCNETNSSVADYPVNGKKIAALIKLIDDGKINFSNTSSKILPVLLQSPEADPLQIATRLNLLQNRDEEELQGWVDAVLVKMPGKVLEYKAGKKGLLGLFNGAVKKMSKGKADMQLANTLLIKKLSE
ncbi:MAG: Asp-tRNA(Asn)/Glu-tRNA(Gln) amidotransferase subunit GatB [Chitinophagaceae bacterium]|nr:Asp-tRNA(Asn)/Glu-tRNA(Gln) amidotransferase subunit GatB [Chitinophagaceae bacterium]